MSAMLGVELTKLGASGIDITFENVGGATLDAAIGHSNRFARLIICGAISQYQLAPSDKYELKHSVDFIGKHLTMVGFMVNDYSPKEMGVAYTKLSGLVKSGELNPLVTVVEGWEKVPAAFVSMSAGGHVGKLVIKVPPQRY